MAFSCGTRFVATRKEWRQEYTTYYFFGRCRRDENTDLYDIRVSNDERRRLIPILKKLQSELSSHSQK
jgi:hypothetical protein